MKSLWVDIEATNMAKILLSEHRRPLFHEGMFSFRILSQVTDTKRHCSRCDSGIHRNKSDKSSHESHTSSIQRRSRPEYKLLLETISVNRHVTSNCHTYSHKPECSAICIHDTFSRGFARHFIQPRFDCIVIDVYKSKLLPSPQLLLVSITLPSSSTTFLNIHNIYIRGRVFFGIPLLCLHRRGSSVHSRSHRSRTGEMT